MYSNVSLQSYSERNHWNFAKKCMGMAAVLWLKILLHLVKLQTKPCQSKWSYFAGACKNLAKSFKQGWFSMKDPAKLCKITHFQNSSLVGPFLRIWPFLRILIKQIFVILLVFSTMFRFELKLFTVSEFYQSNENLTCRKFWKKFNREVDRKWVYRIRKKLQNQSILNNILILHFIRK